MMLVFWLSAQSSLPSLTDRFGEIQSFAGHVIEYAVLALLLQWALDGSHPAPDHSTVGHAGCWAFVIVVAYGITDELHQRFVPGRHMDPFDLLTDAGAAFTALWIAGVARGRRARALPEDKGSAVDRSEQA
jgi:VanZ family protein